MIVCFQCAANVKRQMDDLLLEGGYGDYSELISIAVANLAAMHTKLASSQSLVFSEIDDDISQSSMQELESKEFKAIESGEEREGSSGQTMADPDRIPPIFRLQSTRDAAGELLSRLSADESSRGPGVETADEIPIPQWLFGQFNRLLPIVATTRALTQTIAECGGPVNLQDAAMSIAGEALKLGEYLSEVDKERSLPRDLASATAFPHKAKGHQKAVLRFASQFVGAISGSGFLNGLPAQYRFIAKVPTKQNEVMITPAAIEFASMENPVLDHQLLEGCERLSSEEIDFLISHITNYVPAERQAFEYLIRAIDSGIDSPNGLDELIMGDRSLMKSDRPISDAFVSSQRSGAIARMCDLTLVKRLRRGVRATYAVTDRGAGFLVSN